MSNEIRLQEYTALPLYNIKAVEQSTGIGASTLRAWERRYHICQPQRSDSGYRLYSERDIAVIRWLKAQVDVGMAISQAVAWLDNLIAARGQLDQVTLPVNDESVTIPTLAATHHLARRDYTALQQELLHALINFNEDMTERVLAEAFALYPMELVGENLLAPVLVEIGERWHRGQLTVTREHYATTLLQQRLAAILRAAPCPDQKQRLWVVCAPDEQHEIGALLLTIYLRRAGCQTQFLGKNIKASDLIKDITHYQPAMILLSATTAETAMHLRALTNEIAKVTPVRPIVGYGGRIFQQQPELRQAIAGVYLGDSAYEAVRNVVALLETPSASKTKHTSTTYTLSQSEDHTQAAEIPLQLVSEVRQ